MITPSELLVICPQAGTRVNEYAAPLSEAMAEFGIQSPRQMAAFLAIIAEESWELQDVVEKSDGKAYDPPGQIARNLGNTQVGDGPKYIGRGLGQATGRWMYGWLQNALHLPLILQPALLEQTVPACRSAAAIWGNLKKLNAYADSDQFGACCFRWNGGYNGLNARLKYWLRARHVYGL